MYSTAADRAFETEKVWKTKPALKPQGFEKFKPALKRNEKQFVFTKQTRLNATRVWKDQTRFTKIQKKTSGFEQVKLSSKPKLL